jgi:SAM-dependent methyltransferase
MNRMKIEKANTVNDRELTPPYARYLVPLIRPFENFDLFFVKSLRRRAVRRLRLQPADRVLDVGCGPGGSFPYLVDAVTQSGEVIGVEISPGMAVNAKNRIEKNGWMNVHVIVADAKKVELQGSFDGLLLLGAPDVYACPAALANLGPHLKSNAHVVAFGAKLSRHPLGRMFNSIFRFMFSKATFTSTPELDYEPWKELECRMGALRVEELFFGWMFMAWGQWTPERASDTPLPPARDS